MSAKHSELNSLLTTHRVLTVHCEFVCLGKNSFWPLAVKRRKGPRNKVHVNHKYLMQITNGNAKISQTYNKAH